MTSTSRAGATNGNAKLTSADAAHIRATWRAGVGGNTRALATQYRISVQSVRDIGTGRTWKHDIEPEPYYRITRQDAIRIITTRVGLGYTQKALADAVNIHQTWLSKIENATGSIGPDIRARLEAVLGITLGEQP